MTETWPVKAALQVLASMPGLILQWAQHPQLVLCCRWLRIIAWFGLEESFEDRVAVGRNFFHLIRLLEALSSLTLNISRNWVQKASLGNLFQCPTTPTVKNSILTSILNLPAFSLKGLSLVLSLQAPVLHWQQLSFGCLVHGAGTMAGHNAQRSINSFLWVLEHLPARLCSPALPAHQCFNRSRAEAAAIRNS